MVQIVKSEWHQVEKRYGFELTRDFLDEVYPDADAATLDLMFEQLVAGEVPIEELLTDADNMGVVMDYDWLDEDDWWTDRKGGYEVTYEIGD